MNDQPSLMTLPFPEGVGRIDGILEGYQRYQAVLAALDLGVFEFLDKVGACNRDEIAEGTGINGLFVRDFLAVLVEAGLIHQDADRYRNTPATTDFLLPGSPYDQGDVVRNVARNSPWADLAAALTRKAHLPTKGSSSAAAPNSGPSPAFLSALGQKALRGELQAVTSAISGWQGFRQARRLLDVGGGHGLYAIALCQANPDLRAVVLDQAGVVDSARRYIADYGLEDRVSAEVGDVCARSIGSGYDMVLISHLLYKFRKNLAPIFAAVQASLKPGGLFASNHWFCAAGCAVEDSAVQGLTKALQSFGHPLCREEEFDRLFAEAGFEILVTTSAATPFGPTRLQLAEKRLG
ncbi:MAG: methyltransferase [Thiobacillus sp.]|nr:methyltransferase [Thiobacillus sp.]